MEVGDPDDPATEIGPLVAERQQERVEKYIALGQEEGARVVVGGDAAGLDTGLVRAAHRVRRRRQPDAHRPGGDLRSGARGASPIDDVDDAVRIANDSEYGLAGSVWTADTDQGMDIARRVRTGTYGINQYTMDFVGPFGGFKGSGIGREFGRGGPRALRRAAIDGERQRLAAIGAPSRGGSTMTADTNPRAPPPVKNRSREHHVCGKKLSASEPLRFCLNQAF